MECGKLYKWTEMKTRDIPLPQIAREILECGSEKIYKYYKLRPHIYWDDKKEIIVHEEYFDIIIGCKEKNDAINIVMAETGKSYDDIADDVELEYRGLDSIELKYPRLFSWSKLPTPSSGKRLATIAKSIIMHNTSDIYRVKTGENDFEIVVGARSHAEALNAAVSWGALPFEEDEPIERQLDGPLADEKLEAVSEIYEKKKGLVSLWE